MARRSGLGKGLASLIPPASTEADDGEVALRDIPLTAIEPNPGQPRTQFDEESLGELTASIRELGVLQPILVREVAAGMFQLIAGERRWRAARRAGLATIPAIVRTTDDRGLVEQALVENLQRQDLTALEEAAAFQQLIEDFGLTHDDVATRVGKSRSTVTNTVRLLQLPAAIQRFVAEGQLTAGHARALLGSPDRAFQEQLARQAVAEHWSVRETEDAVRDRSGAPAAVDAHTATHGADAATAGPARARVPPGRVPQHEGEHHHAGRQGPCGHRVRHAGGSRADLSTHDRG